LRAVDGGCGRELLEQTVDRTNVQSRPEYAATASHHQTLMLLLLMMLLMLVSGSMRMRMTESDDDVLYWSLASQPIVPNPTGNCSHTQP